MSAEHAIWTLDALVDHLRAEGYRITMQRQLVLDVLLAEQKAIPRHYSCEEVTARIAERGINLDNTTVYRILQWLKEAGVVAQTDLGQGHDVYSLVGLAPHHHLVCFNCGRTIDIDDTPFEPLRATLWERYQFKARIEHFAIFGLCEDCVAERAAVEAAAE